MTMSDAPIATGRGFPRPGNDGHPDREHQEERADELYEVFFVGVSASVGEAGAQTSVFWGCGPRGIGRRCPFQCN